MYSDDLNSSTLATSIMRAAEVPRREIAWFTGSSKDFQIQVCTQVPLGVTDNFCTVVFDSRQDNVSLPIPAGFRRTVGFVVASLYLANC
jgi:hypothetical protein